jgi:ABC-2 type transport system permease protein
VIGTRTAVWLVARREIVERVRERSLLISTFVTVGILAAGLVLPSALGFGGPAKGTVVAVGPRAVTVAQQARAQQQAFDVELSVRRAAGDAGARALVRGGEADVAVLAGGRALAVADAADEAVIAAVQAGSSAARGARPPPPLPVQRLGDGSSGTQQGIAFVALVILYGQLLGYGFWVATGVIEEKSTRVVELLLSTIRPRELLAGKVIGIGLLGLAQLLLIGAAGVVIGAASGQLDVTADVVAAVGIVLAWFVLGFLFYSCAFAVAGALVPRQEELQTATAPLTILIVMSFFLSFGALDDPGSGLARVMSFIPPSAPMVMPVRLIAGDAAAWEVVASVGLTVLGGGALIAVAARVYGAAVLRTGSRVSLRAVWRAAGEQPAGGRRRTGR